MQGEKCRAVGGARRSRPAARRKSPIAESAPARNFFRDAFSRRLICPVPMRVRVCATSQQWYRRPVLALQPDSMQMQGPPRCGNIGRSVGILPSSRGRPMRSPAAGEEAARARDPAQKDASGKKSQGAGRLGGGGPKPACRQEHPLSRWESQARDGCARAACLCSASPLSRIPLVRAIFDRRVGQPDSRLTDRSKPADAIASSPMYLLRWVRACSLLV